MSSRLPQSDAFGDAEHRLVLEVLCCGRPLCRQQYHLPTHAVCNALSDSRVVCACGENYTGIGDTHCSPCSPLDPAVCNCQNILSEECRCGQVVLTSPPCALPRNLRILFLNYGNITQIHESSFALLPALVSLVLSHMRIQKIDPGAFKMQTNLYFMDLSYNYLTQLHAQYFLSMRNLNTLILEGNFLTQLSAEIFMPLKSLTYLSLSRNLLTELPVAIFAPVCYNMTTLELARNELTALSNSWFQGCEHSVVDTLNLGNNSISALNPFAFAFYPRLVNLTLSFNELSAVGARVFSNSTFTELALSGNPLQHVFASAFAQPLRFAPCNTSDIACILPTCGDECGGLQSTCSLTLPATDFACGCIEGYYSTNGTCRKSCDESGACDRCLCNGGVIDCRARLQGVMPCHFPDNTISIDFSSNRLTYIPVEPFLSLMRLTTLVFANNLLTSLPLGLYLIPGLKSLDLSDNRFFSISIDRFNFIPSQSQVANLSLARNSLTSLSAEEMYLFKHAVTLNLDQNKITEIPVDAFSSLSNLLNLSLAGNNLTRVPAVALGFVPSLQTLNLDFNSIELRSYACMGLSQLANLSLAGVVSTDIPSRVFFGLSNVTTLRVTAQRSFSSIAWDAFENGSSLSAFACELSGTVCQVAACRQRCGLDQQCILGSSPLLITGCKCQNATKCANETSPSTSSSTSSAGLVAGCVVGVLIALLVVLGVFILRRRRNSLRSFQLEPSQESTNRKLVDVSRLGLGDLEISRESITMLRELGRGEFGVVMEAEAVNLSNNIRVQTVAVKVLRANASESSVVDFAKEAVRLRVLDHSNVVKLLAVCFRVNPPFLVLEYMHHGDLKTYMRSARDLTDESGKPLIGLLHLNKLALDCARGFQYLQGMQYVHRDLAARNVLLSRIFVAKIGDFGMARRLFQSEYYSQSNSADGSTWALPIRWMAPESFFDGTWDSRSDAWMFGVLLWELFSLMELPWKGVADVDIMRRVQQREKLPLPQADCPEHTYAIMLDCWRIDPQSRASSADIVERLSSESQPTTNELVWPASSADADLPPSSVRSAGSPVGTLGRPLVASDLTIDLNSPDRVTAFQALEIPRSKLAFQHLLGSGEFGEVHSAVLAGQTASHPNSQVAVKLLKESSSDNERSKFLTEARILSSLHHANIVRVLAVCFSSQPNLIIVELMSGGDFRSYLEEHQSSLIDKDGGTSSLLLHALTQIASAMALLERHRIVHRDLAARNVLVSAQGLDCVKLSDVGLSRTLVDSAYYRMAARGAVPACWMPPESMIDRTFSSASDVWAFGVLVWETYSFGASPYPEMTIESAVRAVIKGYRMPRPPSCPTELYDVVLRCWQQLPHDRPTFKALHYILSDMQEDESTL
eukprot:m.111619 g.111619  ORF g.111619 m.111619 type:complete len:1373 (-) comp51827_c1_seq4:2114-6232(-)